MISNITGMNTIAFLYDSPLRPEVGGTERATKLVMDELASRGYKTIGLIHATRKNPDEYYHNGVKISLKNFLADNNIDIVINQIAFHYWLLESFLRNGGLEWQKKGGKIISFMHLDPTPAPKKKVKRYFDDWSQKTIIGKIKRICFILTLPWFNHKIDSEYKSSLKYLYQNSDKYVLMSRSFSGIFRKLAGLEDVSKLAYITNMLTFPEIEKPSILESKDKSVLIVARLDDEQKNISFMIDVWNKIKNHHGYTLHILGSGDDEMLLKNKAKGVQDIVFEGQKSPLDFYRKSRIFMMASPREGWGLTLTESLQNGVVPVVLNTSTVFKDIIENKSNGFLADKKSCFIDCVKLLLTNDVVRNRMAINGLTSSERFSKQSVGDNWENLIKELS